MHGAEAGGAVGLSELFQWKLLPAAEVAKKAETLILSKKMLNILVGTDLNVCWVFVTLPNREQKKKRGLIMI